MSKSEKGFLLIELLIVVAIILIIASIAVPNMMRAKIAANQSAAVGSLGTILSAEETSRALYDDGYTLTLGQLGGAPAVAAGCANAKLIDEVLGQDPATKSGYTYTFTPNGTAVLAAGFPENCPASGDTGFSVSATPLSATTGTMSYCIDETCIIRFNAAGTAMPAPCSSSGFPPLQ